MNPIVERNKKMEEFFARVEAILTENFEVIGKLLVPVKRNTEESIR